MPCPQSEHRRHVWDFFHMAQEGEVDRELVPYFWHWLFYPAIDVFGPEIVYAIGLERLEYPPTWADTIEEVRAVESAVIDHIEKKRLKL